MDPDKISAEINRLSTAEKLIIAQEIWDSIARESDRLSMPEWQKKELNRRYARYQRGDTDLHDWRLVHDELEAGS